MGLDLDLSDFVEKILKLRDNMTPKLVERGLARAGLQLLSDCTSQDPSVPLDEGTLRGSGSLFVQKKLIKTTQDLSSRGRPKTEINGQPDSIKFEAIVGFNTPYAHRLHEGLYYQFREPGSGAKFIEAKLQKNKNVYMKIIAEAMRQK